MVQNPMIQSPAILFVTAPGECVLFFFFGGGKFYDREKPRCLAWVSYFSNGPTGILTLAFLGGKKIDIHAQWIVLVQEKVGLLSKPVALIPILYFTFLWGEH